MSNPEASESGTPREMGRDHKVYTDLGKPDEDEATRYRNLAALAREGGDTELAARLSRHAADLGSDEELADMVQGSVTDAWNAVQKLTREGTGREHVTVVFPGGRFSEATLRGIRQALFTPDELKNGIVEPIGDPEEGTRRYVVPMQGGMRYLETYHEKDDLTEIEIEKPE